MVNTKRNGYLDFLKGICIFLVLFGHSIQYGSGESFYLEGGYLENWAMKIIYSFHMPLFIAISGYLFHSSYLKYGAIQVCKKKFTQLLKPISFWAIILTALNVIEAVGPISLVKRLLYNFLTNFWFLWAVLICSVCIATVEEITNTFGKNILRVLMYIGLFVLFLFTPDILWLNAYKFVIPYFAGGYYFAKCQGRISKKNLIGILACFFWGILVSFYNKDMYIYTTGITFLQKSDKLYQLQIDMYRYLVGAFGVIAVSYLTNKIYLMIVKSMFVPLNWIQKIVEYLGRNSMILYILSTYMYTYLLPGLTKNFELNYILTFLESVFVCIICLVIGNIIKNLGNLSRWILG